MTQTSPLRRRMIEDMTVRNLSPATQRSYISAVSKLSRYYGRSPDKLKLEDVRAFPGSSHHDRHFLAGAEPDRLRPAVLLRRDFKKLHDFVRAQYDRQLARTLQARHGRLAKRLFPSAFRMRGRSLCSRR